MNSRGTGIVAGTAALRSLDVAADPGVVFAQLARLMVPSVCHEVTVRVTTTSTSTSGPAAPGRGAEPGVTRVIRVESPAALPGDLAEPYVAELICTWRPDTPTDADLALVQLMGRAAADAVTQGRQHAVIRRQEDRLANLTIALTSNRTIGAAVGILMTRHQLTYAQALDLLRAVSQRTNHKVSDLAETVLHTGELPDSVPRRRPPRWR